MITTTTRFSRRAALGAAGLGLAGLAGCGRDQGPGSAPTGPGSAVGEGKATGDLSVWAMGAEGEQLDDLMKLFTQDNPDANVKVTAIPWDSAHDKFTSAIAAGTTPDAAMVGTTWMGEFAELGALDPTPSDLIDPGVFFEGAWGTTEVDGVSYAVPWYVETRMLYVRTDLADKVGVTAADSWEGLTELATAMQAEAGAKWGISLQPGQEGSWQTVMPFAWSNGASLVNEAGDTFTLDTPEMAEAWAYYQSFFTDGLADKAPAVESTADADFASGKVPLFFSGPWMMSLVEKIGGTGFRDKYDVWPVPKRKTSTSFVGGSNFGVFQATKNRDAAWKLVQFLTDPATQVKWYEMVSGLPAVKAAWDDEALQADDKVAAFGKQLESTMAPPSVSTWSQVSAKFDAQVEQVCRSGKDPAEALATLEQEATSIGMGQ